jgi:hypothetical protein
LTMVVDKAMPSRISPACASLPMMHGGGDMAAPGQGARLDHGALQQKMLKQRQLALERQRNIGRSNFGGVAQANHQLPQAHSPSPQLRRPIRGAGEDITGSDATKSSSKCVSEPGGRSLLGAMGASLCAARSNALAHAPGSLMRSAADLRGGLDSAGVTPEGVVAQSAAKPAAGTGGVSLPGSVDQILEEVDGLAIVELGEENWLPFTGPAPRKLGCRSPIGEDVAPRGGILTSIPDAPVLKAAAGEATSSCSSCGAAFTAGQRFCGNCGNRKDEADAKQHGNPFGAASGSLFGTSSPVGTAGSTASAGPDARPSPTTPVGSFFSDVDDVYPLAAAAQGGRRGSQREPTSSDAERRRSRWWNPTRWRNKSGSGPMDQISEEVTEIHAFGEDGPRGDGPRGAARCVDDTVQSFDAS